MSESKGASSVGRCSGVGIGDAIRGRLRVQRPILLRQVAPSREHGTVFYWRVSLLTAVAPRPRERYSQQVVGNPIISNTGIPIGCDYRSGCTQRDG